MNIFKRFSALAVCAYFWTLPSHADQRFDPDTEESACNPFTAANAALVAMPAFEATWDAVIVDRNSPRIMLHRDFVYKDGVQYARSAPYMAWHATPTDLANAFHMDCHRLREELLDGVKTVVISYTKRALDRDPRWYRCTTWLDVPVYRNRKMQCTSEYSSQTLTTKTRWFYRTDVKTPTPAPAD